MKSSSGKDFVIF